MDKTMERTNGKNRKPFIEKLRGIELKRKRNLLYLSQNVLQEMFPRIAKVNLLTGECIFVKDDEAMVPKLFEVLDWEKFQIVFLQSIHPEEREMCKEFTSLENLSRIYESGEESDTYIYRREYKGEYHWIQATIVPVHEKKKKKCILIYAKDVDESVKAGELHKKQLWNTLQQSQKEEAAKSAFIKYIARNLCTPMSNVLNMNASALEAVRQGDLEAAEKYISNVELVGKYVAAMLNDVAHMGSFQNIKCNERDAAFQTEDILQTARMIVEELNKGDRSRGITKNIRLNILGNEQLREAYLGDGVRLQRVIAALLTNAYQFNYENGTIELRFEITERTVSGEKVKITVGDSGCGISKENLGMVFEPFYIEDRVTNNDSGVGLGLYFTKLAVDVMGGTISVKSEADKGTSVEVVVPLGYIKEAIVPERTLKVLVVDDNELSLDIVADCLKANGYSVTCCNSGRDALETFENSTLGYYDAMLVDVKMPGMDGYELVQRIRALERADSKTVKIIAITAVGNEEEYRKAEQCGMNGFLKKPFQIEEFRNILRT